VNTAPDVPTRPRILIADCHSDTREMYGEWFALKQFDIIEAAEGQDALAKALISSPALVMTETWLPNLDGFTLCERLRRDATTSAVPILVVTSDGRPTAVEHARRAGANGVLIKPATPDEVWNQVRRLLQRGRRQRSRPAPKSQSGSVRG
jgi:DNA-binding response OmpR family regulator